MPTEFQMTDRARRVLALATDFALESSSEQPAAEHLLYGLVAENDGLAAKVLKRLDVDAVAVRNAIQRVDETHSGVGEGADSFEQFRQWAGEELSHLRHHYIGTEHLLLSLTHVVDRRALAVFAVLDLNVHQIRNEVHAILGHED